MKLFVYNQKTGQKCKYLKNEKTFDMKERDIFIIFKRFSLKQIKNTFPGGKWEPDFNGYLNLLVKFYILQGFDLHNTEAATKSVL